MHLGDGLDFVMEAVAVLPAVGEDLVVLHPADHVLHSGADLTVPYGPPLTAWTHHAHEPAGRQQTDTSGCNTPGVAARRRSRLR